jgi:negative regulator of sigma E activity
MRQFHRAIFWLAMTSSIAIPVRADEKEAKATIDKAIKAMGGEEKLTGIKAFSAKGKGQIALEGNDYDFTFEMTTKGIDQYRSSYEVEVDGKKFDGVTVLDGDKGWKKEAGEVKKLDGEALAVEKRNAYLDVVPILIVPLKHNGFKLDSASDEKIGDKAVAVVRVTGPEGKEFTLYFDKESGLPVKMNGLVTDGQGEEAMHETTFEEYKDFDGIKVATRSRIRRGDKRYIEVEGMELKVLANVEPETFVEPK